MVTDLISCLQSSHLQSHPLRNCIYLCRSKTCPYSIFETVQGLCSNNIIWQTGPVCYNPLRKALEPKTGFTSWFDQFITMTVKRAYLKLPLLTGTYILQEYRAKFNQYTVDIMCTLCRANAETRVHFLVEQHAHSRTAVRNSRTETVMHALIIWYLRAKT